MTMLLEKFDHLTLEFPEETSAVGRLRQLIESSTPENEYTLNRLIDKLAPKSSHSLPMILNSAVQYGLMSKVYRVNSPALGGIQDFDNLDSIPPEIDDWRQGITIAVLPQYIRLIFKPAVSIESP